MSYGDNHTLMRPELLRIEALELATNRSKSIQGGQEPDTILAVARRFEAYLTKGETVLDERVWSDRELAECIGGILDALPEGIGNLEVASRLVSKMAQAGFIISKPEVV